VDILIPAGQGGFRGLAQAVVDCLTEKRTGQSIGWCAFYGAGPAGVQSKAMWVFHISHTLPTSSGPGFSVTLPGFHKEHAIGRLNIQ
jgi:hypothetical protein